MNLGGEESKDSSDQDEARETLNGDSDRRRIDMPDVR